MIKGQNFIRFAQVLGWIVIFLLPWQTRYIFYILPLADQYGQYGQLSLYATSILLALTLAVLAVQQKLPRKYIFLWPILWLTWLLFSFLWTENIIATVIHVSFVVAALGYYLLVHYLPPKVIWSSLAAMGLSQSLFALWQWIMQYVPASSWFGLAEHDPLVLGQAVVEVAGYRMLRAYGSLPHPNVLAGFLVIGLIALVIYYARYQAPLQKRWGTWVNAGFIISCSLMFLGLLVTFSRAGLLALLIVLLTGSLWQMRRGEQRSQMLMMLTAVFGILFLIVNILAQGVWLSRFAPDGDRLETRSVQERVSGAEQAISLWQGSRVLIGSGAGTYLWILADQYPGRLVYDYQPVHNVFLLAAIEFGLLGVIIWLSILYYISQKKPRFEIIMLVSGLLIFSFFDHWLITSYAGLALWWLSMGLAYKEITTQYSKKATVVV